jgi:hypothetical protein
VQRKGYAGEDHH